MSKKLIDDTAATVAATTGYFACWSRALYSVDEFHKFTRIDKVFLNLMYNDPERGVPVFRRISACRVNVPRQGPVQAFALEQTYRILSGTRKGYVVAAKDIHGNEHYQPAGISRLLEYGPSPYTFHVNHQSDSAAFALLRRLEEYEERITLLSHLPTLYHTYRPDQGTLLRLRGTGEALRWAEDLSEHYLHDNVRRAEENLRKLHDTVATDAGSGRLALPYAYVYGPGVVGAGEQGDFEYGQWVHVPEINVTTNYLEVCHELAEVSRDAQPAG
jgi:hypothetical protein